MFTKTTKQKGDMTQAHKLQGTLSTNMCIFITESSDQK